MLKRNLIKKSLSTLKLIKSTQAENSLSATCGMAVLQLMKTVDLRKRQIYIPTGWCLLGLPFQSPKLIPLLFAPNELHILHVI